MTYGTVKGCEAGPGLSGRDAWDKDRVKRLAVERLLEIIGEPKAARHLNIARPCDLYGPARRNSAGVELGHYASLQSLRAEVTRSGVAKAIAAPTIMKHR